MTDAVPPTEPVAPPGSSPVPAARGARRGASLRRRVAGWSVGVLAFVLLLALAALATAWWAAHSAHATALLLARVPNLSVAAPKGALMGEFSAATIEFRVPDSGRLRIDDLAWRGLRLEPTPPGLSLRLAVARLRAGRVEWVAEAAASKAPSAPP